jgi:hypothetical protein
MKTRHRIPTIFNLSMVDVLCCALGCVILLWLLNLREAKDRAVRVGETSEQLKAAQSALDQTTAQLKTTIAERDAVAKRAEAAARERDQVRNDLESARDELAMLDKKLADLKGENNSAQDRVAKLTREQRALTREKAEVVERLTDLESLLRDKESSAKSSARRAEELAMRIRDAEARAKKLQTEVDSYRTQLADAEARAKSEEMEAGDKKKDLATAQRNIDLLQREKQTLHEQVTRARAAAENRFAGIALTGKRVLFLVDMSGSMELVDERTAAPDKWLGVRETLAKVMRSLPEVEKFQVLLFSDKLVYPLGNEGQWLDYDAKTSADRALRALAAIKPVGATNMYGAFETAFRFRRLDLDTIYVLSDGLPNAGPGATAEQARTLKETELSELLAKYIRNLLRQDWNRPLDGRPRVRINTIGFFFESPDVGAFLWALARENEGSFVGMSKP